MRVGTDPLNWLSDKDKVSNMSFAQTTKSGAICLERLFPSNFNACKLHKLLSRILESHLEDDSMREKVFQERPCSQLYLELNHVVD